MERPLILVTNDDGIQAKGIREITAVAERYGDVAVVAPDGPRSAQSSVLTLETPIRAVKVEEREGMVRYAVSGTPTDCVKLAVDKLITRRPALLISGINHGSNASINVIYSGTMGAAIEGCLHDIPSIGLSLWSHDKDADFSRCLPYFEEIIKKALAEPLPQGICLNVNAPRGDIKGVKVCRQADGRWANEYQQDSAPRPVPYYWLIGDFIYNTDGADGGYMPDQTALQEGYISVVPVHTDMTAYHVMGKIGGYESL